MYIIQCTCNYADGEGILTAYPVGREIQSYYSTLDVSQGGLLVVLVDQLTGGDHLLKSGRDPGELFTFGIRGGDATPFTSNGGPGVSIHHH